MRVQRVLALLFIGAGMMGCQSADRGDFGSFKRSLSTSSYGYAIIDDPTHLAPTKTVERFEVRPGDCGSNSDWSDCDHDRERSELSEQLKETQSGSVWWYGWSIFVPNDYINVYPTKVALGQFHQDKSHPAWMFQNGDGGYHLDNQVHGSSSADYPLLTEAELRGRWHKIEVQVRWSRNDDGFFRVWVNGAPKVDYVGATMSADRVYFKYGLYRSFLGRYKSAKGVSEVPAQTVYFSNVRRSKDRAGLVAPSNH
jgi:hypothetical protein